MKKCPYCAEEIQDEAIKCKHCGEFLGGVPQAPQAPQFNSPLQNTKVNWTSPGNLQPEKDKCQGKTPWFARTSILVISFLTTGPFALPLVWLNPAFSLRKKIIVTVIVLVLTCVVVAVIVHSVQTILDYYKQSGVF